MYADHHVVEVRRILSEISGVGTITASSAFRVLEVEYDSDKTSEDAVMEALHGAGYIGELPIPSESGEPAVGRESVTFFRHTAAVETAGNTISFGQDITPAGRPLWPCPGMGPAPKMDE
jgi:copper chaperone CopZ